MSRIKKVDRNFLDSLYRQYSPKQNKQDLEMALKNFESKDIYEKKMINAKLKFLQKANELDNGNAAYMSIFGLFISSLVLYFKDMISDPTVRYIVIVLLFIYVLKSFGKVYNANRGIRAKIEYLIALLDD